MQVAALLLVTACTSSSTRIPITSIREITVDEGEVQFRYFGSSCLVEVEGSLRTDTQTDTVYVELYEVHERDCPAASVERLHSLKVPSGLVLNESASWMVFRCLETCTETRFEEIQLQD